MSKRKNNALKHLRKTHGWIALVIFMFASAATLMILAFFFKTFSDYLVESKLSSEYDAISYMSKIYEAEKDGYRLYSQKLLNEAGRDYVVRDSLGNYVAGSMNTTCPAEGTEVELFSPNTMVKLYTDTRHPYISVDRQHDIDVDYMTILRIFNANRDIMQKGTSSDGLFIISDIDPKISSIPGFLRASTTAMCRLPVWIGVDIKNGSEVFLGKAYLIINLSDFLVISALALIMVLLLFLIFIFLVISVINSIRSQRHAKKLFFTDMTTGGHNRIWFMLRGENILKKKRNAPFKYALVNMVFVQYQTFCVTHSIADGEILLKKIYEVIDKSLTKKEICAHSTPSSFSILLRVSDEEGLRVRLNELITKLESIDEGHSFSFRAGVDVIDVYRDRSGKIIKRKNIDFEREYNNASTAQLTLSDRNESGIAFFDSKLIDEQKWLDIVEENQRQALEKEEFLVYYQPKYDPVSKELKGAEALIRWNSPAFGFISPGRFIPIFEKNGFITEIDHYMLTHVANDQRKWLDKGLKCVPVSVNISRAHFIESDLAEQIKDIVDAAGTPRELIELELTESAFFDDKDALIYTINRLKGYGFEVSMDDFGSGFSSLNSLKDMPLDALKLDAEFFRGENVDGRSEIVVSETIRLAQSLEMKTVAEGVEAKETVDFLADQGCDMIQGFYFARPMPGSDFEQKMIEGIASFPE